MWLNLNVLFKCVLIIYFNLKNSICTDLFLFYSPHQNAGKVIHHLLNHNANPNVLWSGHSPLSLAVASGNEQVCNILSFQAFLTTIVNIISKSF